MSDTTRQDPPGELELIERYFVRAVRDPAVRVPIGDDAAVVDPGGPIALAVDTLVEGVHFPAGCPAGALGHRVLAVNLSDLAAVGAEPRWCMLALTVPTADEAWFEAFSEGLFKLAEPFGVSLIGGDLTRGPLTLTLQIVGTVREPLTRSAGRAGDDVYVTGTLGDAAAGLQALVGATLEDADGALARRFLFPQPRVAAGLALAGVAHAAVDVSDGLLADLGHIARQSGCGAVVDIERLPLSRALVAAVGEARARELALAGGDDYELCFTAPAAAAERVRAAFTGLETGATRIGRLTAEGPVECMLDGAPFAAAATGYAHF